MLNTDVRGRGRSPNAQTPVACVVGGTRHKLSMISTVANQGKTRWMIDAVALNSDKRIEFLDTLHQGCGQENLPHSGQFAGASQ